MPQRMCALQRCLVSEMNFAGHALREEGYLFVMGIVKLLVVHAADLPDLMDKISSISEVINDLEHKKDHV